MATAASVAWPRLRGPLARVRFERAGQDVTLLLQLGRLYAMRDGMPYRVIVNEKTLTFRLEAQGSDMSLPGRRRPREATRERVLDRRIEVTTDSPEIWFLPSGSSSGSTIHLREDDMNQTIRVSLLGGAVAVETPAP
jgi:Tfp pilus assembly protein FimT